MRRITFSAADVSGTRLVSGPGALTETLFALDLLHGPAASPLAPWCREAKVVLARRLAATNPILAAANRLRTVQPLIGLVDRTRGAELQSLASLGLSPAEAVNALLEIWQVLIGPHWQRISDLCESDRRSRERLLAGEGVDGLFALLGPGARWRPPVLQLTGVDGPDLHLDGRGLAVCPSAFLDDASLVLLGSTPTCDRPVLVYPVGTRATRCVLSEPDVEESDAALGALVGRTRAAALRALTVGSTTTQLAQRLGISVAGASQHASVLRGCGLITTRRVRNGVVHQVTPLGRALLSRGAPHAVPHASGA